MYSSKVAAIRVMRTLYYIRYPSMYDYSASPTHMAELLQEYILISMTLLHEFIIFPSHRLSINLPNIIR